MFSIVFDRFRSDFDRFRTDFGRRRAFGGISPHVCVFATFLGLLADIADGTAARKLRVKSKFGASFDQLSGGEMELKRAETDGHKHI